MQKLIVKGNVAVLISAGYGAGWSTWARENAEEMVFDPDIAKAILDNDFAKAQTIAKAKYPDQYLGGLDDLVVGFVPIGTRFEINEYDGHETLRILSPATGFVA